MELISFEDVVSAIMDRSPGLATTRLVAVDGRSGSGKTTFAASLAEACDIATSVSILHTDDLYDGWGHPTSFDTRLQSWILSPLLAGKPARYRVYDWSAGRFSAGWSRFTPPDVLIMEGVSVAGRRWSGLTSYRIYIDIDPSTALERSVARDGEALRPRLREWQRQEAEYFAADATMDSADLIVDGGFVAQAALDRYLTGRMRR